MTITKEMLSHLLSHAVYRTHNTLNKKHYRYVESSELDAVAAELIEHANHLFKNETV